MLVPLSNGGPRCRTVNGCASVVHPAVYFNVAAFAKIRG